MKYCYCVSFKVTIVSFLTIRYRPVVFSSAYTVQTKRNEWCYKNRGSTSFVALFDMKPTQKGKQWRCYSLSAVKIDSSYGGYKYDVALGSASLATRHNELTAIVE